MAAGADRTNCDGWAVVARHDWAGDEPLENTLHRTISGLDGVDDGAVVYDFIDVEAVKAVFDSGTETRGGHAVRFRCPGTEVQVFADGTIATRPRPNDGPGR